MAFGRPAWRHRWKRPYQFLLVGYVGLIAGDLLAQKLLVGWTRAGVPWTTAPGLVLLAAAALLVPLVTGKPFYCHHICPHGAAQELMSHYRPARFQLTLSAPVIRGLEYLPGALLLFTLVVALLALPFDLAGLEPFAAYVIRSAGVATLAVAGLGLVVSFFVPQAYCRFGCPTGALLRFVRARGTTDTFSRRDVAALVLVGLALALNAQHLTVLRWIELDYDAPPRRSPPDLRDRTYRRRTHRALRSGHGHDVDRKIYPVIATPQSRDAPNPDRRNP